MGRGGWGGRHTCGRSNRGGKAGKLASLQAHSAPKPDSEKAAGTACQRTIKQAGRQALACLQGKHDGSVPCECPAPLLPAPGRGSKRGLVGSVGALQPSLRLAGSATPCSTTPAARRQAGRQAAHQTRPSRQVLHRLTPNMTVRHSTIARITDDTVRCVMYLQQQQEQQQPQRQQQQRRG